MGNTWEGGRDLEGTEWFEYCDSLFLEACEMGRCRVDRRAGGDVMSGGRGGWFGFEAGEVTGDWEFTGKPEVSRGDIIVVMAQR